MKTLKYYFLGIIIFCPVLVLSKIIQVPSGYPTIQAAMDAANPGDTVLVANGTYTGEGNLFLNFNGKAIVVKSENGPENCIIDCQSSGIEAFQLYTGENREAVIEGFKIINGGWVISLHNSSPTIKSNILENDTCGIYCGPGSSPLIENNTFFQNISYGIACNDASPLIRNNTITNNIYLGIRFIANSNPQIENNTISNNQASGISCSGSTGIIRNNTITNNAFNGVSCQNYSAPQITNNNISNNGWPGIYSENSSPEIRDNQINENSVGISYKENSIPLIENNFISNNKGTGISSNASTGTINNNILVQNAYNGVYCQNNSSPAIINNEITNNGWPGITCNNSSPSIRENHISGNYSGIFCEVESNPIIENNDITNNQTGIYINASSSIITNNKIKDNTNSGIYVVKSTPTIINNIITKNIGADGGGIILTTFSKASIINNIISENRAINGGGIYAMNDSSIIINNTIANNRAITGIGIYSSKSDQIIINNIIAFSKRLLLSDGVNIVSKGGSGLYRYSGGILVGYNESKRFVNMGNAGDVTVFVYGTEPITFFIDHLEKFNLNINWGVRQSDYVSTVDIKFVSEGNEQPFKSQLGAQYVGTGSVSIIKNGILAGGGVVALGVDPEKVSNCLFFENTDGNYFSSENAEEEIDISSSNDNLIADPQFYECGQYMLSINSPCIDKGVTDTTGLNLPEYDIYGTMRIMDGNGDGNAVIDIGACEFNESLLGTHEYISICQGESYEGWTESGDYQRTLTSTNGNDSIVTTHLTVNPTFETEEDVSICEGENYLEWSETGIYERIFTSVNGCDSVVRTNLAVHLSFKPEIIVHGDTINANSNFAAYQWCDAGGVIAGATNRELIISHSGEYYLEATSENGCTYASDAVFVTHVYSTPMETGKFSYSILPNPNSGIFDFTIETNPPERIAIELVNSMGQVIEKRIVRYPAVNHVERFHVAHLSAGFYHIVVISDTLRDNRKIVIQ